MGMTDSLKSKTHTADPVVLIKTYTVPSEEADYFTEAYQENARIMSRQPGFIRSRLHRPLADAPETRFVHVAEWSSGPRAMRSGTPRSSACSTTPNSTSRLSPPATASSSSSVPPDAGKSVGGSGTAPNRGVRHGTYGLNDI